MQFSENLRDAINDAGIGTLMTGFAVSFFDGVVPTLSSDAITGTKLITFTIDNDGVTGGTFSTSSLGIISRTIAEAISGTCLATGSPTHFRIHAVAESPTTASLVFYRMQGTCGANATYDMILDSTFFPMTATTTYSLGNISFRIPY